MRPRLCHGAGLTLEGMTAWTEIQYQILTTVRSTETSPMRHLPRRRFLALCLGATLAIAAPGVTTAAAGTSPASATSPAPEAAVRIAVSTPVLADIVARAVGPRAEVWSIVPPTGDPHSYSATPRDLERAATADLYVEMGANLERYAESGAWRRMIAESGMPVVRLQDHVDLIVRDLVIDHGDHVASQAGGAEEPVGQARERSDARRPLNLHHVGHRHGEVEIGQGENQSALRQGLGRLLLLEANVASAR